MKEYDLVIIGGGPAGLSAAYEAYLNGVRNILIIERDVHLGGILNQCIHNGFGLTRFKEELTGPEYAYRYEEFVESCDIEIKDDTMVLNLDDKKNITYISAKDGYQVIHAKAIVLAMGCRERTRGAISIPGDRCAGIFTAGACQKYVNIDGYMVGQRVVILGSGDIGLIMARRLTLEGAKVLAVVELMPYSNGLNRNIVQCLNDYNIPLYLSHTVSNIIAKNNRVEKVVVSKVDDKGNILKGDEMIFECDTLLLSVGLIPENELSKSAHIDIDKRTSGPIVSQNYQTSIGGIFACGNVLHVHDLVDFVSLEGARVGKNVAKYLKNEIKEDVNINIVNKNMVSYTIPQHITSLDDDINIFFRVRKPMQNKNIVVRDDHDQIIFSVRKLFLAPGEMENIIVKKDKIGQDVKEISVQVEDL